MQKIGINVKKGWRTRKLKQICHQHWLTMKIKLQQNFKKNWRHEQIKLGNFFSRQQSRRNGVKINRATFRASYKKDEIRGNITIVKNNKAIDLEINQRELTYIKHKI